MVISGTGIYECVEPKYKSRSSGFKAEMFIICLSCEHLLQKLLDVTGTCGTKMSEVDSCVILPRSLR